MNKFAYISFSNKDFFHLAIGKRATKKELHSQKGGDIPIISARLDIPFGFTDSPNFVCFNDSKTVLWNIDSSRWDTRVLDEGTKFIPTDHCGYIHIKRTNIIPEYIAYVLYKHGLQVGFKHEYRASITNLKKIAIPIPVDDDGNFDVFRQIQVSKKYNKYNSIRTKLYETIAELNKKHFHINSNSKYKTIRIGDIMSYKRGKSIYTQKYCIEHPGAFPVYSAGTKGRNTIGYIDSFDYEMECVKITTNGHYAGTPEYIPHSKFSLNGDVAILYLTDNKNHDYVCYEYISYALKNARYQLGFNWNNKPSKKDILDIEIFIPSIDDNFDIVEQKRIIEKFNTYTTAIKQINSDVEMLNKFFIDIKI